MSDSVIIESRDYWFKVVEMLQQNWALIEPAASGVTVYFINDTSGVFDEMPFPSMTVAADALRLNGFNRFADDRRASAFLRVPPPPFYRQPHPNGLIYSSGRFWRSS
jgi:hypothetical protein